jgi:GNAT superfamily N-acetyltransferase
LQAREYSAREILRDGRELEIRALRPEDRTPLIEAARRLGDRSLYNRFFAFKRHFTEREIDTFVNVDFIRHVALVAQIEEGGRLLIVGGARYVVVEPGEAEVAFAVDDQHQRLGIGTALMRHVAIIARRAGLTQLIADVLPDNKAMLRVFEHSELEVRTAHDPHTTQVLLRL